MAADESRMPEDAIKEWFRDPPLDWREGVMRVAAAVPHVDGANLSLEVNTHAYTWEQADELVQRFGGPGAPWEHKKHRGAEWLTIERELHPGVMGVLTVFLPSGSAEGRGPIVLQAIHAADRRAREDGA